ncbi:hypothetical protein PR202_gb12094 [Eleusine coracana subsp. coracana]|uniref:F-box protein AT5G49610-like beta-propeller domain-containing protein n=1 Tax=Eleusine coracana subsp. coracana TaxID=191504 RepID=A0AAV5EPH7_ELECO|nr:hypothetical protein PR202_gb12094 [Eleusine coracana subsp. coracana]
MAAPPPAVLIESMVEEILLRFPPDDPASLVRAALVCKPWWRLVAGRRFRRRFREFHRRPPVLGLLCNSMDKGHFEEDVVRFVPAASFPPTQRVHLNHRAIDARHGRVLLRCMIWDCDDLLNGEFVIWDPITHKEQVLPSLPRYPDRWSAAVVCAATASGTCDHLDCSHGPFLVVVVDTEAGKMFVHVYSSETGRWSEQRVQRPNKPPHWLWPSVLVGNELCFLLRRRTRILKYNLLTREICMMDLPSLSYKPDLLTSTDDGRLGFATVRKSRIYLWSREDASGDNAGWTESRVIKLESLLPVEAPLKSASAAGFAAGVGIIFVRTKVGVFSIDLKSQLVRKMRDGGGQNIVPYMSFYTPGRTSLGYLFV